MGWIWWLMAPAVPTLGAAVLLWSRARRESRRAAWARRDAIDDHGRMLAALDRGRLSNLSAAECAARAAEPLPQNLLVLLSPADEPEVSAR